MRARAALRAVGAGRCEVLRSDPPLTFRETSDGLQWVGSAAAPVGGDDLALDVTVVAGASLRVGSVAASIAHPGPTGAPSSSRIEAVVDGSLTWAPQPTVLVRGCDHRSTTTIRLGGDASLVWREEVILGRHEEEPGSIRQRLDVERAGRPLVRTELAVGPRWAGSLGPAGTAGMRAVGSLLVVGAAMGHAVEGARAAVQQLDLDAVLVTVLAPTASALRVALDDWLAAGEPAVEQHRTAAVPSSA